MDMVAVLEAVNTVGFPIAVAIAMFWHLNKERESHAEESRKVTEALNNNTIILEKLLTKLGMEGKCDEGANHG